LWKFRPMRAMNAIRRAAGGRRLVEAGAAELFAERGVAVAPRFRTLVLRWIKNH
jgi:hypothetical protein